MYHDALGYLGIAGGYQALFSLYLHHTDAAGADLVDILQVAQVGISRRAERAASRMVVPSGTVTVLLSMVSVTI